MQLLGVHVTPEVGQRVLPAKPGLAYSHDGSGVVSRVDKGGGSVWVRWDYSDDECGLYKTGDEGIYTLKMMTAAETEGPQLVMASPSCPA